MPVHLTKETCKIPEVIARELNWQVVIVRPNNDPLATKNEEVPHVRFVDLPVLYSGKSPFSMMRYLLKNASQIDTLMLFHFDHNTWLHGIVYKLLNPRGFLWNKLDLHEEHLETIEDWWNPQKFRLSLSRFLSRNFLKVVDLISSENKGGVNLVRTNAKIANKVVYLPSGLDQHTQPESVYTGDREKTILNVARLGTDQKATDVLLEAFAQSKIWPEWQLVLVGPVEPQFSDWLESYSKRFPDAWKSVQWKGEINSRQELAEIYAKCGVFCLPSRYESFGLALLEAGYYGCPCIGSDCYSIVDMLQNGECGKLCVQGDAGSLAEAMKQMTMNDSERRLFGSKFQKRVIEYFTWDSIVQSFAKIFDQKKH